MAKTKSKWVCQSCGYESFSYLGKCPECGNFATFIEEITSIAIKNECIKSSNIILNETKISKIKEIELERKIKEDEMGHTV